MKLSIFIFSMIIFNNCRYFGLSNCLEGNCSNGIGVYTIQETIRKGLFRNGKFLKGEYILHDECTKKGEFESYSNYNSYSNGYLNSDCNGEIHDGYWKLGLPHGEGTVILKDKKKFSGIWNEQYLCFIGNCLEGFGFLVIGWNGYYIGEFKGGKPTGKGLKEKNHSTRYYLVYIGDHLDLSSHGQGIQINEDGIKKGRFEQNVFVGK